MAGHTSSLRVRVELEETEPPLWRRLELASDMPLSEVHGVLQTAFGWTDSHLHRFSSSPDVYDPATVNYLMPFEIDEGEPGVPEGAVRLGELLVDAGDRLTYTYDFGDDWTHTLELESTLPRTDSAPRAVCTAGERPGPPEDCGGVDGYEAWCAAADPSHPDHAAALASFRDIVGTDVAATDFTMSPFDIDEVNRALAAPVTGASDLPAALADLLRDTGDAVWLQKAIAGIPRPDAPDAEAAARAVHPFTWLLDRVGIEGITLTGAGYLPPEHVQAVAAELGIEDEWYGKFNRESQTLPVLAFRESAQQAKLVRKHKGKLVLTPAGRRLRADPVGLWWHLAAQLPLAAGGGEVERHAGLLTLIGTAAGWPDLDDGIARGLDALGWVGRDGPLNSYTVNDASRRTRTALLRLAAFEGRLFKERVSEHGVAFARAAVWTWP